MNGPNKRQAASERVEHGSVTILVKVSGWILMLDNGSGLTKGATFSVESSQDWCVRHDSRLLQQEQGVSTSHLHSDKLKTSHEVHSHCR